MRQALSMENYLIGEFAEETFPEGHQQDLQVKTYRPMLNIIKVMLYPSFQGGVSPPAIDLGPSGHPCLGLMPKHVQGYLIFEFLDKMGPFRAGANQAHLSFEHVEQLGKLIKARPS